MGVNKIIGNSKIREEHRLEILNFIRKSGHVSRTDIFKKTKISKPTVTRVIEELLKEDLIKEAGFADSSIGRRPVYIELNPSAYYCIGVNVSRNSINISLVDFTMNVCSKKTLNIKGIKKAEEFNDIIANSIIELINESKIENNKILGIGIGVPGMVDYQNGIVIDFALAHNIFDIRIKEYLEKTLKMKVYVDNNANTRALGEYWYGYGVGYQDIVFVICSEGVGSGIITNGDVLRGKNNINGGLGHMTVNISGRKCTCGKYGCVEAYSSTESIESITKDAFKKGKKSALLESIQDIESIDYQLICKLAENNDPLCMEVLKESAFIISTGLANLIGIINTEMVILSGNMFDSSKYFYDAVEKMTKEKLNSPFAKNIVFKKRKIKDNLYDIGAATMIYNAFFKD